MNVITKKTRNARSLPARFAGPVGLRLALAAAGLGLCAAAQAGEPVPLSERQMSAVHAQGLAEPTVEALSRLSGPSGSAAGADANASAGVPGTMAAQLLASLSSDAARGLDRRLAAQEVQVASSGLQNTINLSNLMVDAARFQAPLAAVPALNLPLLFAFPVLPALPTLPPPSQDHNGGGH